MLLSKNFSFSTNFLFFPFLPISYFFLSHSSQHGFPTIMYNIVVSCTSGSNINDLRDKIFDVACQVKENTGTPVHAK